MKTELSPTNQKIEVINTELMNLYCASQNKTEYTFFDFHKALIEFNESVLMEGCTDYFRLKANQFRDVFSDLLFTESKAFWIEPISYDPQNKVYKLKYIVHTTNVAGLKEEILTEIVEDEHRNNYLIENIELLKSDRPKTYSVNKYNFLLESCKIKHGFDLLNPRHWAFEKEFKKSFDGLFNTYNLDWRKEITFEDYIDKLNFQKKFAQMSSKPQLTVKGFQSNLIPHQIDKLYKALQGNYINTEPDNFKAIFSSEPLSPDYVPIKILKPFTGALLAYFVSELFQKENPGDYWNIAEHCFKAKNLRQSLNNTFQFNPSQKPKGYEEIDSILKNIDTPLQ